MISYTFKDEKVEHFLNVEQAAKLTNYSVSYIRQLVWKHQIPFYKKGKAGGRGAIRFKASELQTWMGCTMNKVDAEVSLPKPRKTATKK